MIKILIGSIVPLILFKRNASLTKKAKILLLNMIPKTKVNFGLVLWHFKKIKSKVWRLRGRRVFDFYQNFPVQKKHLIKSYIKSELSWKKFRPPSSSIYTRRSQEFMCHSERPTCKCAHILSDILQLFCKSFMDSYWSSLQLRFQVTFLFDRIYVSPHLSKYGLTYY